MREPHVAEQQQCSPAFFVEIKELKYNIMKVKDFLMDRYGLDVKDFSNPFLNDIRNHLIYEGLCCSIVF